MRQSLRIAEQCLDRIEELAGDPWISDDRKVVLPPREELQTSMESLIHHFKLVTEGYRVPAGEVYVAIESSRGEQGCYLVSDGGSNPWRVHFRAPSFPSIAAQTGYAIDSIIVDGVSKAPAATYTFSSVAMGHSIAARFKMTTAIAGGDFAKANPAGPGISLNGREIILSVPGRGIWNVSIISLTGQEIPVLRPQAMAAGVHTVMLPRLVVRGCYIAKLSCGDRVFTKAVYLEE